MFSWPTNNVIVSDLRSEVVALYSSEERPRAVTLQNYLNTRAAEIKAMGYKVIRIPMPGPVFSEEDNNMFRSYSNSITVNDHVIIPRYVTPGFEELGIDGRYFDDRILSEYEAEVEAVYESQGFKVTWIATDDLIVVGGAVHCTTMQIASPL